MTNDTNAPERQDESYNVSDIFGVYFTIALPIALPFGYMVAPMLLRFFS